MQDHVREHGSLLAAMEKRLLVSMARRLPQWVTSDQLTLLALAAMAVAGGGYALTGWDLRARWLVVAALAVNWFGDSLDGTVARVRRTERPRYGFYVDHVVDIAGSALLFAGLAASPFMSAPIALAVLVAYLLVSAEVYLATAVHRVFRMSFAGVGPTELRILMAIGTVMLARDPRVNLGALGQWQLFDVGGVVATAGLVVAFGASVIRNTRDLARLEPPQARPPGVAWDTDGRNRARSAAA
jgi:phosphatidylglycerophosphate synthase